MVNTGAILVGVAGAASIDETSWITATGSGYARQAGISPGRNAASGGAHGGVGGDSTNVGGNVIYGDMFAPVEFGSGGQASAGGGAIRVSIGDGLILNGIISSNGIDACGAGAGIILSY